jgi:flagellar hook protein FlgE
MLGGVETELGLSYVNGSLYQATGEDGTPDENAEELPELSRIASSGNVKLMTGFLEAPNVDLATEISELITTQRGYQANTRIITVTDSMLEELVNMKR